MSAFPNSAGESAGEPEAREAATRGPEGAHPGGPAEAGGGVPPVPGPPPAPPATGIAAPESEIARLEAERDEYLDALRRLQAEFDNYRKRTTRQQTELLDRAAEGILERMLPVLDAIDLAVQHGAAAPDGAQGDGAVFAQIASLLTDALARDGLERIDAVGVGFDPAIHDAVAHLPAPEPGPAGPSAAGGVEGEDGGVATSRPSRAPVPDAPASDAPASDAPAASGARASGAGTGGPEGSATTVVAEVLRAGYRLKGRVLRPAMVTVQG